MVRLSANRARDRRGWIRTADIAVHRGSRARSDAAHGRLFTRRPLMRLSTSVGALGCTLFLTSVLTAQSGREEAFIGARGRYWAFQKVQRPPVPPIRDPWI